MKNLTRIFLTILIYSVLCTNISYSQKNDSVRLKLNLKKGDRYIFSSEEIGTQSMERKPIALLFTRKFGSRYLCTIDDLKSNGNIVMTLKLLDVTFSIKSKGLQASMDSRDSSKTYGSTSIAQREMRITFDGIQKMIGMSFWVELNERGEIFRSNLDTVFSGQKDYERMISGDTKQLVTLSVCFPDYPVKKGDSWNEVRGENHSGKVLSEKMAFTLLSIDKKFANIKSSSASWGDIGDANLNATYNGKHKVDIESGLSIQSNIQINMESKEGTRPFSSKDEMIIKIVKQ